MATYTAVLPPPLAVYTARRLFGAAQLMKHYDVLMLKYGNECKIYL
jgi:hypothetical protein